VEVIGFRVGHPSGEMNEYLHDIGTMSTLYASYRRPDGMDTSDGVFSMIRATLTTSEKRAPLLPSAGVVMNISARIISVHYIRIHIGYAPGTHIQNAL